MKLVKEKLNEELINESGVQNTMMSIRTELSEFLKGVVVPKSNGYVKNERDAALLLCDILKTRYKIGN